jgi:hypothetical protein
MTEPLMSEVAKDMAELEDEVGNILCFACFLDHEEKQKLLNALRKLRGQPCTTD